MLIRADELDVRAGSTIENGRKLHFKASVAGGEGPRLEIAFPAVRVHRNVEGQPVELVRLAVHKEHVLAGTARVAEAVADIEAHDMLCDRALRRAPVPGVFICPDAAPPVEQTEGLFRFKEISFAAVQNLALGAHTDDLLIVIERGLFFRERGRNDHGILRLVREQQIAGKGQAIREAVDARDQMPLAVFVRIGKGRALERLVDIALFGGRGEARPAEGKPEHGGNGRFLAVFKVEEACGDQPHIGIVCDGQRNAEAVVVNQVVIPFLDAALACANRFAVIGFDKARRVACFTEMPRRIEQRTFVQLILFHAIPPLIVCGASPPAIFHEASETGGRTGFCRIETVYRILAARASRNEKAAVVKAVLTDSKISRGLYGALGYEVSKLKKTIRAEVSRSIASSLSYADIARNLRNASKLPLSNANRIVRTEGHRIQQASTMDAQRTAKAKGADVVKQWDATLDGKTRDTHRQLDTQIREVDEPFEVGGKKVMMPGYFGDPAEDCNCRCACLTRARWALDEDELQTMKDRAEFFGLDKTKDFEDFEKKYLRANKNLRSYDSNPYVIKEDDLPPTIYQFRDYEDFKTAVDKWRKTHDGSPYDHYVQNSAWSTTGLTDEQIGRIKMFDATIAKLQTDYPLPGSYSDRLYIGSFENIGMYLNDIQRSRIDDIAQAQFWFNPDDKCAVIGFDTVGLRGTLTDDLLLRESKLAKGERLQTVLDNSPEGTAIHEWGHGYTDYISKEMVYGNPAAEDYWKWYKSLTKEEIGDGVSSYAMTNRSEFEAECFAELLTGNPRPIAVKFSEYLEKCVESHKKRIATYGIDAVESGTAGKIDLALNYAIKRDTSSIKTIFLPKQEYAHVMSEIATNLTETQKQQRIVSKAIGNYVYTFENNGFADYRIIGKKLIDEEAAEWWNE